jgi:hypothetical protein
MLKSLDSASTVEAKSMIGSRETESEKFPLVNPSIQHPIYVKAYPLREPTDVSRIKAEIIEGNILIVKITPIAKRSVEETKLAISELMAFIKSIQGDIARLGEERIVMTPPTAKVWRGSSSRVALASANTGSYSDEDTE